MLLYKDSGLIHIVLFVLVLCTKTITSNEDVKKIIEKSDNFFDKVFGHLMDDFEGYDTIKKYFDDYDNWLDHTWEPINVLDKYPDNYKNHTSKTEDVDGTKVQTNETVYKKADKNSKVGIYIKQIRAGNKTRSSSALKYSPEI